MSAWMIAQYFKAPYTNGRWRVFLTRGPGSSPGGVTQYSDIYICMCIETEEICEVCGEKYWQGDILEDQYSICDPCRGRPKEPSEKDLPFDKEKWLKTIMELQK